MKPTPYPRIVLLLLCGALLGCATNPVTGRNQLSLISEREEIAIGEEHFPHQQQQQGGLYMLDADLSRYVAEVGHKLAEVSDRPELPYEFVIINDSSWNAWAMPGGKIAINRGLVLALGNESELAAVLAHEIVHAAARHGAQQMQRGLWMQIGIAGAAVAAGEEYRDLAVTVGGIAGGLGMLNYSRSAEEEADYYGILYMTRAGYDPIGAVTLQELFAENKASAGGWLSSHPASIDRVRNNRRTIEEEADANGYLGEAEYRVQTRRLREQRPAYDLYDEGVKALRDKKPRDALRLARQAIDHTPREALFHGLEARAHQELGDDSAALDAWDRAIDRNPNWFFFPLERGMMHKNAGRRDHARRDLERSFELLPTKTAREALDSL